MITWPVVINGRNYAVDPNETRLASIERIRQQADPSREFGEASLNPEDLWRRSQEDWSGGAGQEYLDKREDSSRRRFFESGQTSPWVRGDLRLSTAAAYYADLVSAMGLTVANGKIAYLIQDGADWKVYAVDAVALNEGSAVYPATDLYPSATLYPETPTNSFVLLATGTAETGVDITSDGFYAYVLNSGGVDQVNMDTGALTAVTTQTGDWIDFAKGRLLVGNGGSLFDATSAGGAAATDITPSTLQSGWTWTGAAEAGDSIYVSGSGGERSMVYRVTIAEDAANLTIPVPAATLPFGEQVTDMYGYVGSVVIGTTKGFRVAQPADAGLFYGPLVEVGRVTALSAFGKFVYFGGNTDADLGFVGKINLGLFTEDLVPAYALDLFTPDTDRSLQGTETEEIRDIVVLGGAIMWLVENHLWYEIADDFAVSGDLSSGKMTYDLAEHKVFARIQVHCKELTADESIDVYVNADESGEVFVTTISGTGETGGDFEIPGPLTGGHITYRLVLNRGAAGGTTPKIERVTVRALPRSSSGDKILLPLILRERVRDLRGVNHTQDPAAEYAELKRIERSGELVPVTLWGESSSAVIDRVDFGPRLEYTHDSQALQGTATVLLRTFHPLEDLT